MKKGLLFSLIAVFGLSLILSACTKSNNAPSTSPSSSGSSKPSTSASQPPASPKTSYQGEIVISISSIEDNREGYNALIAAYNQHQPNVRVVLEPVPADTSYASWLGTQLAAGNPRPDIVSGNFQNTYDKYVNMDRYRTTENPYTGNKWDEDLDFDFLQSRNAKGERIMVATQGTSVLWYYNKDMFDQHGLQPPTNFEEFVSVSEKLKAAGITPVAATFGNDSFGNVTSWLWQYYTDQHTRDWRELVRAQPNDWNYDNDKDGSYKYDPNDPDNDLKYTFNKARFYKAFKDGDIRFDTQETANIVANLAKIFPQYAIQDFYNANATPYDLFLQQNAAMFINTTGSLSAITNDMKDLNSPALLERMKLTSGGLKSFNWSTFSIPGMTGDLVKGPVRTSESATGQYVSVIDKNQQQTDMVMDFVQFWLSKPGYQAYVDGLVGTGKFSPGGPVKIADITVPAEYTDLLAGVKRLGGAGTALNSEVVKIMGSGNDDASKGARQLLMDGLNGKITPQQFAEQYQALWVKHFDLLVERAGVRAEQLVNPEIQ